MIVDADVGLGNALGLQHAARSFEPASMARADRLASA